MNVQFDVNNKKMLKRLKNSKRFVKYPEMFLGNTCKVKVNNDDYLMEDEFIITCKYKILPKTIYLYGKKSKVEDANNLYLNYWLSIFFNTIEKGNLCKQDLDKDITQYTLTIGLPLIYRAKAFKYNIWDKEKVISFLSCLFNVDLEESNYEQQDLFGSLLVA